MAGERLAAWEGLSGVALRSSDAPGMFATLRARGIGAEEPIDFARAVDLGDGARGEARFTVTRIPEDATPGMSMFIVCHHTPEFVWLPELTAHRNTAVGISSIVVALNEPAAARPAYERLFGKECLSGEGDRFSVRLGSADIELLPAPVMADRYPGIDVAANSPPMLGMGIAVSDLAAARDCLAASSIGVHATERGLAVAPADSCGVVMEFVAHRPGLGTGAA